MDDRKNIECDDCGRTLCGDCRHECGDCRYGCVDCGGGICENCIRHCADCDEPVCGDCYAVCENCDEYLCQGCRRWDDSGDCYCESCLPAGGREPYYPDSPAWRTMREHPDMFTVGLEIEVNGGHDMDRMKDSGLIVSRRVGKEVYYRAADTEVAQLLHQIIERTVEVTCPQSDSQLVSGAPHLPPLDQHDYCGSCPAEQLEVIRQVHRFLTEHLDSRITIEQLSRQFLMNPSTMKELFKEVYGSSIAAHIRQHRMERASALLLESDDSVAQIARAVGYESQSKFTSEFKKAFSMLPTEYRRLHKQA